MPPEINVASNNEAEIAPDLRDWGIGIGAAVGAFIAGSEILERVYEQNPGYSLEVILADMTVLAGTSIVMIGGAIVSNEIRNRE